MTEESKEIPQHCNYCPSTYVDHGDEDGNTILGSWRAEEDQRGLQRIERMGTNNRARTATQLWNMLCDYFVSKPDEKLPLGSISERFAVPL